MSAKHDMSHAQIFETTNHHFLAKMTGKRLILTTNPKQCIFHVQYLFFFYFFPAWAFITAEVSCNISPKKWTLIQWEKITFEDFFKSTHYNMVVTTAIIQKTHTHATC